MRKCLIQLVFATAVFGTAADARAQVEPLPAQPRLDGLMVVETRNPTQDLHELTGWAIRHGTQPTVPTTAVPSLGGPAKVSLARFRGQVVLVSFWAPWCAPCIQQEPELAKINRELRAKNTGTVVLVSAYSSLAETRRMVRRDRLSVPILSANPTEPEGRAFYRAFLGSESPLPVTFVVDAADRVVGYTEGRADLAHLRALLNRAEG